jgi:hypothetical protein
MVFANVPRVSHPARPIQVRFFQAPDIARLESEINEWLGADARREIVDVRQSVNTAQGIRQLIVSIWYIES